MKYGVVLCSLLWLNVSFGQAVSSYDFIPDASYDEVADRISCLDSEIALNYNERVKSFVDYFTVRDRDYTRGVIKNSHQYFPLFEKYLDKYDLPDALKYLAVVESGLRTNAISRANAVGLWQFVSSTGKLYGLKGNWYIDDKMDPEKATDAACRHLRDLYNMFGDWELAMAAYNCGPGNVRKAIRRSGYKRAFWDIYRYLPRETRSYVPQFVAIVYTFNYAHEHNLEMEHDFFAMETDTIQISQYFHMETFANQLNVCLDDLLSLNPSVKRGALPEGTKEFGLRIPSDLKDSIVTDRRFLYDTAGKVGKAHLEYLARNTPGSTYGRQKLVYKVRSGDVLGKIANRYHVRISDIKAWNNLRSNLIRIGQRLNIWVLPTYSSKTKDLYASSARTNQSSIKLTEGQKLYRVQPGDTLWSIANAHSNASIEGIKRANNLRTNTIQPGQQLIIAAQ